MKQDRVIALGFFDGVHVGHRALLERTRLRAQERNCRACVLTFSNHPDELVFGRPTPLINTLPDRQWLLTGLYGMDEVVSIPFDRALMQTPWEQFVDELLVNRLGAAHVVCGHDFCFGSRGEGTPDKLRRKCEALGIGCDVIEPVTHDGRVVSSTEIRALLQSGSVEQANELLGHCHFLTGTVVKNKQLGSRIGIPTANVRMPEGIQPLAFGVYATRVRLEDGRCFPAVTNVGVCPTVGLDTGVSIEAWILDFAENIYGQTIRVEFYRFLRPERKFSSLEELKDVVLHNADQTRAYFAEKSQA